MPDFDSCVERVEAGIATELEKFIYEYDDADRVRSGWFMHRLENVIAEVTRTGATK